MKNRVKLIVGLLITAVIAAVAFHSVQEIHYLKTFYTGNFTVTEASLAAAVELIKVLLVAGPLVLGYAIFARYAE